MLLALRSLWEEQAAPPAAPPAHQLAAYHLRLQASKWAREKKKRTELSPLPPVEVPPLDVLVAGWSVPSITLTIGEGFVVIGSVVSAESARIVPRISSGVFHATLRPLSLAQRRSPRLGYGKAVLHRPPPIDPREFTADDLPALALIIAEL